ncbi:MAG: hypothetical protein AAF511_09305, partial [Pseudomonadota bacterium]
FAVFGLLDDQIEMEEFQMGQTVVMASFEVTDNDITSLSEHISDSQKVTDYAAFDAQAQAFVDYVNSKDTEVGIVTIGNEIIMIDRNAFSRTGAETYTFSWETDEGQVISMIGLRSEFQAFDLIA